MSWRDIQRTPISELPPGQRRTMEAMRAARLKHGASSVGASGTPEYVAWKNMKRRCCDPKHNAYEDYGGRGIRVCDRWLNDFAAFLSDVGSRPSSKHSIDRINNDGNYEPGNVRWATRLEQAANRRRPAHWRPR